MRTKAYIPREYAHPHRLSDYYKRFPREIDVEYQDTQEHDYKMSLYERREEAKIDNI